MLGHLSSCRFALRLAALATASAALAACAPEETCDLPTYPDQCVDRATIWAAVQHGDAGASVPAGCPTLSELRYELVNAYALGLEGWDFIDGPSEDTVGDRCCYTTRAAPCE